MAVEHLATWQIHALDMISMLIIATSTVIIISRDLRTAVKVYSLQAALMALSFFLLGFTFEWFIGWGVSSVITKVILTPWILLHVLNKVDASKEQEAPLIPYGAYLLIIPIAYMTAYVVVNNMIASNIVALGKEPMVSSLTLVLLGLTLVTTTRNIFKQILGLILFENGSHVMLASLAYKIPETVEIGITSDAIAFVVILSILVYKIYVVKNTLNVNELTSLKY